MNARPEKGENIIDFPEEYIAVDLETTGLDFQYDEIIEVGAVRVKSGEIISQFSSLIRPSQSHCLLTANNLKEMGFDNFGDLNQEQVDKFFSTHLIPEYIEKLTGIANKDLLSAPQANDVLTEFLSFVDGSILVGHNINFDVNFLYDALEKMNVSFTNDFIDTMRISRKLYTEMPHHRLVDLTERLGVKQSIKHRALEDAMATAQCYEIMKKEILLTQSFSEFISKFAKTKFDNYKQSLSDIKPTVADVDETNPVFGKVVVFTGTLSSVSRKEAFQIVVNLGGYPENSVTRKTNFLVVGNEEFAISVKNGKTNKMVKAENYRNQGFDISTLSENTFFEMIQ